ncbi:DUF4136 domain-containing protein [Thalassotalea fusca]
MKKLNSLIIGAVVMLVAACTTVSPIKANFDRNDSVDTSNYKTFAWLISDKILADSGDINPVMKLRVDDAIEQAFITKGYQLVDSAEQADFVISYTVGSRDKVKIDSFPVSYRGSFGWGRHYYGSYGMATETHVRNYTEGKLAVDVYDVKSRQPAWHGWATKRLSSSDKQAMESTIKAIADEVINQF